MFAENSDSSGAQIKRRFDGYKHSAPPELRLKTASRGKRLAMKDKGLIAKEITQVALLFAWLMVCLFVTAAVTHAQVIDPDLRPDMQRARATQATTSASQTKGRANGYTPSQAARVARSSETSGRSASRPAAEINIPATTAIQPGTPLTQLLHTSQLSSIRRGPTSNLSIAMATSSRMSAPPLIPAVVPSISQ